MAKLFALRLEASCWSIATLRRLRNVLHDSAQRFFGTPKGLSVVGSREGKIGRAGEFEEEQWGRRSGNRRRADLHFEIKPIRIPGIKFAFGSAPSQGAAYRGNGRAKAPRSRGRGR